MSAEDAVSERVRFDDNISFIDDSMGGDELVINAGGSGVSDNVSLSGRLLKVKTMIFIYYLILVYDRIPNIRPLPAEIIRPNIRPRWPNKLNTKIT